LKKRFILLADTSGVLVDTLKQELETTAYALLHAKDGQEAIDYLELLRSEIDLAIIALELPVVSGLDVIWRLVKKNYPKHTRIIATSHVKVPKLKQAVRKFGVDAVIQVPLPGQEWRRTIESVLGGNLRDTRASAADSGG
jgi:CheY-like chemotaxis protein